MHELEGVMERIREAEAEAACREPREDREALLSSLRQTVGGKHVVTGDDATRAYRKGFRFGNGRALAVIRPGTLVE
ncbi:MAG: hypothetical protein ACTHJZ_09295, partial [Trinickia sp.]|uniref:hypothetical protein n=1 Tax=Trinickia sp. TaxID=2571163 RepID=UPI003F812580